MRSWRAQARGANAYLLRGPLDRVVQHFDVLVGAG